MYPFVLVNRGVTAPIVMTLSIIPVAVGRANFVHIVWRQLRPFYLTDYTDYTPPAET